MKAPRPSPSSRLRTGAALAVVLVALGLTAWRGAELYAARERVQVASDWLAIANDWQITVFGTARAIDAGDLARREDGGFTVPWEPPTFPVTIEACEARVLELLGTYPLPLDEVEDVRMAFRGSAALLSVEAARVALEDVALRDVVRALDRHGNDVGRLTTPVAQALADDAEQIAADAFVIAALLGVALLIVLALRP